MGIKLASGMVPRNWQATRQTFLFLGSWYLIRKAGSLKQFLEAHSKTAEEVTYVRVRQEENENKGIAKRK